MKKIKYSDQQLIDEMISAYKKNNNVIPINSDWKKLSQIDSSTISRRFGGWTAAWDSIGLSKKKQSAKEVKIKLISDFSDAFDEFPDINSNYEILKLSGHRIGVIQKYFVSLEGFINTVKLDARQRVFKEDVLADYVNIYEMTNRIPTKKDIKKLGKYRLFVYYKYFADLNELAVESGIDKKVTPVGISEQELINELKSIEKILGRVPGSEDIYRHGKFSVSTYSRHFGSVGAGIKAAGFVVSRSKQRTICELCGESVISLTRHMKQHHVAEFKKEEDKVLELYRGGLSNMKISTNDSVIFDSASAISRVVNKHTTAEERKKLRLEKIKATTNANYKSGKMDRVIAINKLKNTDSDINKKISDTLKESYGSGKKKSWNKGQTKETNSVLMAASEKQSSAIKELYKTGQIERTNSASTKRNRLGAGFSSSDRRLIKKRANYRCESCYITQEDLEGVGKFLECDHILPIYKGGVDNWENNGQALCSSCHLLKTAGKRFYNADLENISTKVDCHLDTILEYKGRALEKDYIKSLDYTDRYDLALNLLEFFKKYDFGRLEYSSGVVGREMKSLYNKKSVFGAGQVTNKDSVGIKTCRKFFPNILNISSKNMCSISDVLGDQEKLLKVIMNRLGGMLSDTFVQYFDITPANIITGAKNSFNSAKGSIFKPVTAKAIYDHWVKDGDTVYDYSGGFGGRMLGLIATGKEAKYIAAEPNSETYSGLVDMAEYFDFDAEIYKVGSEDFIPENIDFAFSSPPYFDYEEYSPEKTQSCVKYPDYNDWLEGYWRATVKNIRTGLNSGGILGVNAGNKSNEYMIKIYEDMNNIVVSEGFKLIKIINMVSNSYSGNKLEPINFYKIY